MSDENHSTPPPHRAIRSFVLRTGRATQAQQRALTELWPQYGVEFATQLLDLDQLFGRSAPRVLEIGFGTGEALCSFARTNPEIDCLGIEVHPPGVGRCMLDLHAQHLMNCRVLAHDAVEVLKHQIPPASLTAVHIFFPDPWPKKRHHKRRLIQPDFVQLLARALTPGGLLRLATDWEPYAQHMSAVLGANSELSNEAGAAEFVARPGLRPLTRFERRGQRLGHGVWDLAYKKNFE